MNFIKANIKWIIFIVFALIITNILTGISIDGISKKEQRKQQHKLDSLQDRFKQLEFVHVLQYDKIKKIISHDSLLQIKYNQKVSRDEILIMIQAQALTKFQKLGSKINLYKLDSAYDAEVH